MVTLPRAQARAIQTHRGRDVPWIIAGGAAAVQRRQRAPPHGGFEIPAGTLSQRAADMIATGLAIDRLCRVDGSQTVQMTLVGTIMRIRGDDDVSWRGRCRNLRCGFF